MVRLLAIGDVTVDRIIGPFAELPAWGQEAEYATAERRLGGNSGNLAAAAAALGADVVVLGPVGNDASGAWLTGELASKGVRTERLVVVPSGLTSDTTALVRDDGERLFLTMPGVLSGLDAILSMADFPSADFAVFSGWCQPPRVRSSTLHAAFTRLKQSGTRVVFDLAWSEASWRVRDDVLRTLAACDVVLMNEDELLGLTGVADLDAGCAHLVAALAHTVILIKRGRRGALVAEPGQPVRSVAPIAVTSPQSTVGSGDVFIAGFVVALAERPGDVRSAAEFGADYAMHLLMHGRDVKPTISKIRAYRHLVPASQREGLA